MLKIVMKKPIDWTKVEAITYDTEAYLDDVPFLDVLNHYLKMNQISDNLFSGTLIIDGNEFNVIYNKEELNCFVNEENLSVEEFVLLFEAEGSENKKIFEITGLDLDDYITEIVYKNGYVEKRETRNKT